MINLDKTRVIVCTYPDYAIDHRFLGALTKRGLPLHNVLAAPREGNVIERRNRIIKHLVVPVLRRYEWFLFADHDHYEKHEKLFDPFFEETNEEVVGCEYATGADHSWLTPDMFHMGLVRIRSEVFANLEPPWFKFTYNEEHTKIVQCECGYLRNKILEAGYKVTRRGKIEHTCSRSWC